MGTRAKRANTKRKQMLEKLQMKDSIPKSIQLKDEEREHIADTLMSMKSVNMRQFVLNILDGMDKHDAFVDAYPDCKSPKVQYNKVTVLLRHPKVKEITDYIRKEIIPARITLNAEMRALPALEKILDNGKSEKAIVAAAKIVLEQSQGTPKRQIEIHSVSWHGTFDKSFLRDRMREHQNKNLRDRGEGEIIDVKAEPVSDDDEE